MDQEMQAYYDLTLKCVMRYGGLEELEAKLKIDKSKVFEISTEVGRANLFHEEPYFWAMEILYGRNDPDNYWFKNPDLWPPPDDYYKKY